MELWSIGAGPSCLCAREENETVPTPEEAERLRLEEDRRREKNWKRWGPYLAERQWGTVREDYSPDGDPWRYFPHDHARSRTYRWGEDGLLGITDRECRLSFALALWNGRDPILKERLFGLTNPEGNHGEDVKEYYFYLDSTPTHSYMKALYKYPQAEYPYVRLVAENAGRTRADPEFELLDAGVFRENRYFDVLAEYAKHSPNDIAIRLTVTNRGPQAAPLDLLATLWFRNTWASGSPLENWGKPKIAVAGEGWLLADHSTLGRFHLAGRAGPDGKRPALLFTENETNTQRLFHTPNATRYVKDAFHEYVVRGRRGAVNPARTGTKAAAHYHLNVPAGEAVVLRLRLFAESESPDDPLGAGFEAVFNQRIAEADAFYRTVIPEAFSPEARRAMRQAYAGLLWTRQFYYYVVKDWLEGDPKQPPPPPERKDGPNSTWTHVHIRNILSMPDKWEYPWFASWDLAFEMLPLARIDPDFAKDQLVLMLREWSMHPNGQLPAYEFALPDVNPPVHAWACWRTYKIAAPHGRRDRRFLERTFQKLLLNFTWWVNRKDVLGRQIFAGGFLGMDNIGIFDRSKPLPGGGDLEQADGTAWMAFFAVTMLAMALELAKEDDAYEDMASKFLNHFIGISDAMNNLGGTGLWDDQDGFYYDHAHFGNQNVRLRIRSLVGLMPLIAVEVLDDEAIAPLKGFVDRMNWFLANRQDLARQVSCMLGDPGKECLGARLLALPSRERLRRVLRYMLDENEFLSPYGIRSVSLYHKDHPFILRCDRNTHQVDYEPGEARTALFGGNSNWRGPVWMPINYLLVEALERYHHFYGESFKVECPTGSGRMMDLKQVAGEITRRLCGLFLPGEGGRAPWQGNMEVFAKDPFWKDLVLFHEYFHGDAGQGLGASHQTGWTALIVRLLEDLETSQPQDRHLAEPAASARTV